MKNMIRNFKILLMAFGLTMATSCNLDLLVSPNAPSEDSLDPNFLLNRIQQDLAVLFRTSSGFGMEVTRMINLGGSTYETAYNPQRFDGVWSTAYSTMLTDINTLIPIAETGGLTLHAGIAQVAKAYVLMNLVDMFGDVPLSEALDPANFNPKADPGASIYTEALTLLDEAIANFALTPLANPVPDFYYNGNRDNWRKLAKTMQFRLHLNRRLVDTGATAAMNALIADNDMISTAAQNFRWLYGRNQAAPDSRHPRYTANYISGGGQYQSNFYMWHLTEAKGFDDPRARFYLYRQTSSNSFNVNEISCINETRPAHYPPSMVWCWPGDRGYWGRDHIDNDGIPPDNLKRTVPGVYPAGGRFDANVNGPTNNPTLGNQGAGLEPIMMRSFLSFMRAEAALLGGTTDVAKTQLLAGITASMDDVRAFAVTGLEASTINAFQTLAAFNGAKNNYVATVEAEYDAAGSDTERMRIIAREYWLALYGNGNEMYNLYRRTGQPDGMQPGLEANFGNIFRSFYYPSSYVNRNSNASAKPSVTERVFWDNNPVSGWID